MSGTEESTDPEATPPTEGLVAGARRGDAEAFGTLYRRIAPAVFAWVSLRLPTELRGRLDPEDVIQEIWARALDRFSRFDPARGSFRAWLFGVASRVLLESLRRTHRHQRGVAAGDEAPLLPEDVPDDVTSQSRRLARDEAFARFLSQVRGLAEDERRLILFRGLEGLPHDEVARRLDISRETSMKRWQRLRERLTEVRAGLLES